MYKRDVGILLLSAFAVYFSVQHEGPFSFQKAWYHHLDNANYQDAKFPLPAPIVADLNGDGKMEVLVATHDSQLQVLTPRRAGRAGDGFAAAGVIAQMSLAPAAWPAELLSAKRAVAVKNGFLDPKPAELVRALRKQVVVVVLADWTVMCFDHNLRMLWSNSVKETVPGPYGWASLGAHVREVAIHISNHTMRIGDRGVVVVGGSVELGDLMAEDVLEAELAAEKESEKAQHDTKPRGRGELVDKDTYRVDGVDISRHFSYYAMEGQTGETRWRHEGQDFHRDVGDLAEQVIPQHNYRLDAKALEGRHYGEAACRDFRESVLASMPHRWTRRSDTELKLAHFRRHREGRGERKNELAETSHGRPLARGARPPPDESLALPSLGADHRNPVARLFGKVARKAVRSSKATTPADHGLPPNVLVAHLEEGIEAVHLYSGRTICKLHLPAPGLHTDLNADGVLDHIQVVGENLMGEQRSDTSHRHGHSCWASALSGVPPRAHFFNGSVCSNPHNLANQFKAMTRNTRPGIAPLEVAPPTVLPQPGKHGRYRRGSGLAVFLNSRGEVTAYDEHGQQLWQISAGVNWENFGGEHAPHRVTPTLEAIPFRWGGIPVAILAAGAYSAAILSEHGHVLDEFRLPAAPVLPLQAADFSGDGLTDVILVSQDGVFGYVQVRRPGGVPFSALLGLLIIAMAVVYVTQQAGPRGRSKRGRSTDRVD